MAGRGPGLPQPKNMAGIVKLVDDRSSIRCPGVDSKAMAESNASRCFSQIVLILGSLQLPWRKKSADV